MGLKDLFKKKKKPTGPPAQYTDKDAKSVKSLSTDTANAVYKTGYKTPGMKEGYFKPDQAMAPASNAVGAYGMAQKLGMQDVIPETKYAEHKVAMPGEKKKSKHVGAVSAAVEGKAMMTQGREKKADSLQAAGFSNMAEFEQFGMESDRVEKDGSVSTVGDPTYNNDVDLSRPETQSSLNRIQWFDAIIGNKDRHSGNLIHDEKTGIVSGIDNDLSFDRGIAVGDIDKGTTDDKYVGMPDQVDAVTAGAILGLTDADVEAVLKAKGPTAPISGKDLDDAKARLKAAQVKVQKIVDDKELVDKWDAATFAAAAHAGDGKEPKNYLQRHLMDMGRSGKVSNTAKGVTAMPPKPQAAVQPQQQAPQQQAPQQPMPQLPALPPQAQQGQPQPQPRPTGGRVQDPRYVPIRGLNKPVPRTGPPKGVPQGLPQLPQVPQGGVQLRPTGGRVQDPRYAPIRGLNRANPRTVPNKRDAVELEDEAEEKV